MHIYKLVLKRTKISIVCGYKDLETFPSYELYKC